MLFQMHQFIEVVPFTRDMDILEFLIDKISLYEDIYNIKTLKEII